MKKIIFLFFVLVLLLISGCMYVPPDVREDSPSFCNSDDDCLCGGIDTNTDNCFVGNKDYAAKFVDFSRNCPDFCTGIAGHLETRCVENECKIVPIQKQPVACTAEAKLCPDGSAVGRTGPNCEFAPCPGECVCPEGFRKEGDVCNPGCYYSTPPCLAPSIPCEKSN